MAKDNGNGTVTVVSGDTLSAIAKKYSTTVNNLVELNKATYPSLATNKNLILVGWVLRVTGSAPAGTSAKTSNTKKKATVHTYGLMANSDRTLYAEWTWNEPVANTTEEYKVRWWVGREYNDGTVKGELESETTVKYNRCSFTAPDDAVRVSFYVQPISKEKGTDGNGNRTYYWTADWSDKMTHEFTTDAPSPDSPSASLDVDIKDYTLTMTLSGIPDNIKKGVHFQVSKDNEGDPYFVDVTVPVSATGTVSYSCSIDPGHTYKVRYCYVNDYGEGGWSSWSGNSETAPSAPSGITTCRATSTTSVYLAWGAVSNATGYDIQYSTDKAHLEGSNDVSTVSTTGTSYTLTGLESGKTYFFQVRATNSQGNSAWTSIASVTIGEPPAAPTTWSSTTTAVVGEPLTLYWVHNSEDGSAQVGAEVEITANGLTNTYTVNTADEEDDEKTMHYSVSTSGYVEGAKLLWRVRTKGATGEYGDWSMQRTVDIYAKPTLSIGLYDYSDTPISVVTMFPIKIIGTAGPNTQTPTGYHVSVISNTYYETVDEIGNRKVVNIGDEIFSKYIDTTDMLSYELSANNIDLENNGEYTVKAVVSMDSGLTGEDSRNFTVTWDDGEFEPSAEIGVNNTRLTTVIGPYCTDENGDLISGISLSVYRREYDGSFTEIAKGLDNLKRTYVTDPHPPLDYARYRVVAIQNSTGAVSFFDLPAYPVGEKAIIIQWDESWNNYEPTEHPTEIPSWSGSMLKLSYNIDTSEERKPDISLINYIGRKNPVSYYGTQIGETASWSVEIPKTDKETIYALRRLAIWMGDVYVREPSGVGYWAHINVSFSIKHLATTIPVKLSITRVAGGM